MRRHLVGILALFLFAGAVWFHFFPPSTIFWLEGQAGCWRMGTLLGVWWLAWPQAVRLPRWLLLAIPLLAVVLVFRPRFFFFAIPLVVAIALLMPRSAAPQRGRRR